MRKRSKIYVIFFGNNKNVNIRGVRLMNKILQTEKVFGANHFPAINTAVKIK
jgi:hypothetical protein